MIPQLRRHFEKLVDRAAAERRAAIDRAIRAGDLLAARGSLEHEAGLLEAKEILRTAIKELDTDMDDDDNDTDELEDNRG